MKKLVASLCMAVACVAATTCRAQEPTPFDNYVVRSAEMTYFYGACSKHVEPSEIVMFMSKFAAWRDGSPLERAAYGVIERNWREGVADAEANRFTRGQCFTFVIETSTDWLSADRLLKVSQ